MWFRGIPVKTSHSRAKRVFRVSKKMYHLCIESQLGTTGTEVIVIGEGDKRCNERPYDKHYPKPYLLGLVGRKSKSSYLFGPCPPCTALHCAKVILQLLPIDSHALQPSAEYFSYIVCASWSYSLWLGTVAAQQCPTSFPSPPNCDNCTPLVVQRNGQAVVSTGSTR